MCLQCQGGLTVPLATDFLIRSLLLMFLCISTNRSYTICFPIWFLLNNKRMDDTARPLKCSGMKQVKVRLVGSSSNTTTSFHNLLRRPARLQNLYNNKYEPEKFNGKKIHEKEDIHTQTSRTNRGKNKECNQYFIATRLDSAVREHVTSLVTPTLTFIYAF